MHNSPIISLYEEGSEIKKQFRGRPRGSPKSDNIDLLTIQMALSVGLKTFYDNITITNIDKSYGISFEIISLFNIFIKPKLSNV